MDKMTLKKGAGALALISMFVTGAVHAQVAATDRLAAGDAVASFEMYWPERDAAQVADRTAVLAALMVGRSVAAKDVESALVHRGEQRRVSAGALSGAPELALTYLLDYDEIRLSNNELLADTAPEKDIGEAAAIEIAGDALKRIGKAGLLDAKDYAVSRAQIGTRKIGGGTINGGTSFTRIVEYRVTFRRMLNGIEMANSGLRIGVHASGQISSLRFGGVEVKRERDKALSLPAGKGDIRARTLSDDAIQARFEATRKADAQTRVAYSRLMYVMPDDVRQHVVSPSMVYAFAEAYDSDAGEQAVSRRQIIGFDVTDAKAPTRVFTAAAKEAPVEAVRSE